MFKRVDRLAIELPISNNGPKRSQCCTGIAWWKIRRDVNAEQLHVSVV